MTFIQIYENKERTKKMIFVPKEKKLRFKIFSKWTNNPNVTLSRFFRQVAEQYIFFVETPKGIDIF